MPRRARTARPNFFGAAVTGARHEHSGTRRFRRDGAEGKARRCGGDDEQPFGRSRDRRRKALEDLSVTDPRAECLIDLLRQGLSRAEFRMIRKKWQLGHLGRTRQPKPRHWKTTIYPFD